MLADQVDYIVGVDPHRDVHALAVVEVRTGAVVLEAAIAASMAGYRRALELADESAPGRRAFAVEGSGSFGAGLTRFLTARGEAVYEVGRLRRERRSGGKTDALDAIRAARVVLTQEHPAEPRAAGEREALRALMAARDGAVNARRAALCQLRDLIITAPEPLRSELRPLTCGRLLKRLAAVQPSRHRDAELRGTLHALRSVTRRIERLTGEERELESEISALTRKLAPHLLDEPGIGPRRSAAAALLVAPRPRPQRSRLRPPRQPPTLAPTNDRHIARRRADGKSSREANRCLKRYLARNLYRLLEHPPIAA